MIRSALILALLIPLTSTYRPQYVPSAHFPTAAAGCPTATGVIAPVECWLMNEGSGTVFHTSSATGNDLTSNNTGGTWGSVAGFPGSVYTFNGSTFVSAIGANQTATNFTGATAFSITFWMKLGALPSGFLGIVSTIQNGGNFTGYDVGIPGGSNHIDFRLISNFGGGDYMERLGAASISTSTLYFIACTTDGTKTVAGSACYINGTLDSVGSSHNGLVGSIANAVTVHVGNDGVSGASTVNGPVADVRIYNFALTPTQVSTLNSVGPL